MLLSGAFRDAGQYGDFWSVTVQNFLSNTSANAYYLIFSAGGLDPSHGPSARWYGYPIRCLAY